MQSNKANIAVLGAGLMGHAIAQVFLAKGHAVALHDPNQEALANAKSAISAIFVLFDQSNAQLDKLSLSATLAGAVEQADFVVEAGPEKLEIKQAIFQELVLKAKPSALLATNTSALTISEITAGIEDSSRIIGTHFWNPPHLIRLVEVVQTETADPLIIESTINLLNSVGMQAVHIKRDIPGLVGNRLQHAMKREAIALIEDDICDAETIDTVVKSGFAARLAVLGPMEQSDMVGLNLTINILNSIYPALDNSTQPQQLLVNKVKNGDLGMKTGKGFRDWTTEQADAVKHNLNRYLVEQAKQNQH